MTARDGAASFDMAVVTATPIAAAEQTVRSRDPTYFGAAGKIASPVHDAPSVLADIERHSAGMFVCLAANASAIAAHELNRRAVRFQIIDKCLKLSRVARRDRRRRSGARVKIACIRARRHCEARDQDGDGNAENRFHFVFLQSIHAYPV